MIGIITDSTCDIPEALQEELGIYVIPQMVIWGDSQYRDRIDLDPGTFYKRLAVDPLHPHTSQPALSDFEAVYDNALSNGARELIVLTLSSTISGTYQTARKAAESFAQPIEVVDSKATSMGLGWQVLAAARASQAGADLQGVIGSAVSVRERIIQFAGIDSLRYLQKGGRIGDVARWAGTLLKIKPLVSLDILSNKVEPIGIVRTYKAMIDQLFRKFMARFDGRKKLHIAVLHGCVYDSAKVLAQRILEVCEPEELLINSTGPALGIHTGPSALGLCGYAED